MYRIINCGPFYLSLCLTGWCAILLLLCHPIKQTSAVWRYRCPVQNTVTHILQVRLLLFAFTVHTREDGVELPRERELLRKQLHEHCNRRCSVLLMFCWIQEVPGIKLKHLLFLIVQWSKNDDSYDDNSSVFFWVRTHSLPCENTKTYSWSTQSVSRQ